MIEVLAALTILAIAMLATATVFYGSLRTAGATSFRSAAAALATRETEALHGVPYDSVGFYPTQQDYLATFEDRPTVSFEGEVPAGAVTPTDLRAIGPIRYDIRRHITWSDAEGVGGSLAEAYKETTVIITWNDQAGAHEVRQDSVFYPGGLGAYAGPGSDVEPEGEEEPPAVKPNAPTLLVATQLARPDGLSKIDLSWTAPTAGVPPHHYLVEASATSDFSGAVIPGTSTTTNFRVSGLNASTPYYFRVYAVSTVVDSPSTTSLPSDVATASTADPEPEPVPVCAINSFLLSNPADGGVELREDGGINEDVVVTLNLSEACSTLTFKAKVYKDTTATTLGGTFVYVGGSQGTRTVTWASKSLGWAAGIYTIRLTNDAGVEQPGSSVTVKVCSKGVKTCP